jgi:hypothetical protein
MSTKVGTIDLHRNAPASVASRIQILIHRTFPRQVVSSDTESLEPGDRHYLEGSPDSTGTWSPPRGTPKPTTRRIRHTGNPIIVRSQAGVDSLNPDPNLGAIVLVGAPLGRLDRSDVTYETSFLASRSTGRIPGQTIPRRAFTRRVASPGSVALALLIACRQRSRYGSTTVRGSGATGYRSPSVVRRESPMSTSMIPRRIRERRTGRASPA